MPALQLDDGKVLTEGPAVVQYLADQKPESGLAPRAGTFERYQLMEILNYLTSEVHKGFGPLFNPEPPPEWKAAAKAALDKKFDWLTALPRQARPTCWADTFTVADAYLFTLLSWTAHVGIDLGKWPVLARLSLAHRAAPQGAAGAQAEGCDRSSGDAVAH